jgi:hypothetical protein
MKTIVQHMTQLIRHGVGDMPWLRNGMTYDHAAWARDDMLMWRLRNHPAKIGTRAWRRSRAFV